MRKIAEHYSYLNVVICTLPSYLVLNFLKPQSTLFSFMESLTKAEKFKLKL